MTTTEQASTRDYLDEDDSPMLCNDCGRPIFYDYADEAYHHAVDPSLGCFLIWPEESTPTELGHKGRSWTGR